MPSPAMPLPGVVPLSCASQKSLAASLSIEARLTLIARVRVTMSPLASFPPHAPQKPTLLPVKESA